MTEQANWLARRLPDPRARRRAKSSSRKELRRVVRMFVTFSGGRKLYLLALGMLIFEAVTAIFQAYPLAFLIDFLRQDRPGLGVDVPFMTVARHETVFVLTAGLVLLTAVNSLADSMAEIYLARGGRNLGYNMREALYRQLQRLSLAFHDQRRTGDVLTRVTSDVTALEEFVVKSFGDLAGGFLVLGGTLIFLLVRSWQVAIVAVLIVPIMALISNYFSERIKVASKRQRGHEGDLASSAQEMLTSIRVVQTYGRSTYEERRFGEQSRKSMEAALDTAGLQAKFSWVVAVLEALATTVVVWLGLWLLARQRLSIGTLVLFVLLIENMFKPTKKIIKEWSRIGKIFAAAERIAEVLDREPSVKDRPDAVEAPPLRGDVRFRDVSFAYQLEVEDAVDGDVDNGRRVALEEVSFAVAPGEVVALVGHSGAGKSTMAQLIPRLYDPDEGVVLMDGLDIRTFTLASLRSQIGVVLQDTVLFTGTVSENIAYGREDASREQVVEAAKQANAHDFIMELPDGYDTMLGERAANLSGGQRQRISIARAFIRGAPILILDEPTTGLDSIATDQVVKGLRSLIEGKTTIIVSHNPRLIRSADRILVVEAGRIVESGTHEELSRAAGAYAEFGVRDGDAVAPQPNGGQHVEPGVRTVASRLRRQVERARRWAETVSAPAQGANGHGRETATNGHGSNGKAANGNAANGHQASPPTSPPARPSSDGGGRTAPRTSPSSPSGPHGGGGSSPAPGPAAAPSSSMTSVLVAPSRADWPADLDPLATTALHQALPGLAVAFEPAVMAERLQVALFGTDRDSPVIERCEAGKAMYLGEDGCRLRYQLSLREPSSGRRWRSVVLGRLLATEDQAAAHLEGLAPLVAAVEGRPEVAGMARSAARIDEAAMVVHAFPIDGDLPALVAATDRVGMGPVLAEALGLGDEAADGWRIGVGHYGRRHRCVLRYEHSAGGSAPPTVVYGKLCWDHSGAQLVDGFAALQDQLADAAVRVPSLLGYRPELGLSLLAELPGEPLLAGLRRRDADAPARLEDQLEIDTAAAGRVAAALHRVPAGWGRDRSLADEVSDLRAQVADMASISPGLASRLDAHLDVVAAAGAASASLPAGLAHGDYTFSQLLDDRGHIGLLDFDSLCQAEPSLDLGQFVAYLRLGVAKAKRSDGSTGIELADRLRRRFHLAYAVNAGEQEADAPQLAARTEPYQALSLLRITVHGWQKLKASRAAAALSILEEDGLCRR